MTEEADFARRMIGNMNRGSPQAIALGFETVELHKGRALLRVPFHERLVGDPETGVIAGGVVTTLLDHCCGQAVHMAMTSFKVIATLDLRIDYMRPARAGAGLIARADCYKMTRSVAFVRAVAFDESEDDPVAAAQAAFMIDASSGKSGSNLPGGNS